MGAVAARDVAQYILEQQGVMTAMKVQKLVYYSQAWSLVWDGGPLFHEAIEAWANGPVVRELFVSHRGKYNVGPSTFKGDARALNADQRATVDAVLEGYGALSAIELSELSHSELPWRAARTGAEEGARSKEQIALSAMESFYRQQAETMGVLETSAPF